MTNERFNELVEQLRGASIDTLLRKNSGYATEDDRLHNFNAGAEISGLTPAQTAWGYLTKHLVALRDKVWRSDFTDVDDFLEKCQDSINYIVLIWCLGHENNAERTEAPKRETTPRTYRDVIRLLHPEQVANGFAGGVCGCPKSYFRDAPRIETCSGHSDWRICNDCWSRPYRGEELINNETD